MKSINGALLLAAIGLAVPAAAQQSGGQSPGGGSGGGAQQGTGGGGQGFGQGQQLGQGGGAGTDQIQQQVGRSPAATSEAGAVAHITGVVRALDYDQGTFTVRAGDQAQTIYARPKQLASLVPGDLVSVRYRWFGQQPWLVGTGTGPGAFSLQGTLRGTVANLDKQSGTVTLSTVNGTATLRANPNDFEQIVPGQFVAIDYQKVNGQLWAEDVQVAGAGGMQQGFQQPGARQQRMGRRPGDVQRQAGQDPGTSQDRVPQQGAQPQGAQREGTRQPGTQQPGIDGDPN